jgi:hypothetical protein
LGRRYSQLSTVGPEGHNVAIAAARILYTSSR